MQQPVLAKPGECSTLPSPAAPAFFPVDASTSMGPLHHGAEGLGPGPGQGCTAWLAHEDTAWPAQEDTASPADALAARLVQEGTARPADAHTAWPVHDDTTCLMQRDTEACRAVPAFEPVQLDTLVQPCPSPPQPFTNQAWPADSERSACPLLFDDDSPDSALASVPIVLADELPSSPAVAALPEVPSSPPYGACAIVFDGIDEDGVWQEDAACMEDSTGLDPGQGGVGSGALKLTP